MMMTIFLLVLESGAGFPMSETIVVKFREQIRTRGPE
jgi:hypothetical protein